MNQSREHKIVCTNVDEKIWNRDIFVMDLMQAIHHDNDIIIDLNAEGSCAKSLGIYEILDQACTLTGYSRSRICIKTCNLLESHPYYYIEIQPPIKHLHTLQNILSQQPISYKKMHKHSKHFGHFIGHGNRYRLAIASHLWSKHSDKSHQTYHTSPTDELHNEFVALEDLWFNGHQDKILEATNFLRHTPVRYDHQDSSPILHSKTYGILPLYENIFVDISSQPFCAGSTFFVDEKIWRPIITKTPFIVQGPRYFLNNLQRLGFRTFDRWWDEGYSEDPPDCQVRSVIDIIDKLSSLSHGDLQNLYEEMKSILDHNYDVFMSLDAICFEKNFKTIMHNE